MLRISASLSEVSEQNAGSFGPNTSGLPQNPLLTTLITVLRMEYKYHEFQVAQRSVLVLCEVTESANLTPWYQHRDPLVGVLDYIVEVRPPGADCSFLLYLPGQRNVVRMSQRPRTSSPLPMMMTFSLSKGWYVQVKMLGLIPEVNRSAFL